MVSEGAHLTHRPFTYPHRPSPRWIQGVEASRRLDAALAFSGGGVTLYRSVSRFQAQRLAWFAFCFGEKCVNSQNELSPLDRVAVGGCGHCVNADWFSDGRFTRCEVPPPHVPATCVTCQEDVLWTVVSRREVRSDPPILAPPLLFEDEDESDSDVTKLLPPRPRRPFSWREYTRSTAHGRASEDFVSRARHNLDLPAVDSGRAATRRAPQRVDASTALAAAAHGGTGVVDGGSREAMRSGRRALQAGLSDHRQELLGFARESAALAGRFRVLDASGLLVPEADPSRDPPGHTATPPATGGSVIVSFATDSEAGAITKWRKADTHSDALRLHPREGVVCVLGGLILKDSTWITRIPDVRVLVYSSRFLLLRTLQTPLTPLQSPSFFWNIIIHANGGADAAPSGLSLPTALARLLPGVVWDRHFTHLVGAAVAHLETVRR
jgi:hypothetical protein